VGVCMPRYRQVSNLVEAYCCWTFMQTNFKQSALQHGSPATIIRWSGLRAPTWMGMRGPCRVGYGDQMNEGGTVISGLLSTVYECNNSGWLTLDWLHAEKLPWTVVCM